MGLLSRLFGSTGTSDEREDFSLEDALAGYIIREHREGRDVADIIEDPYLRNRAGDEARRRLLERPDVIRAVGEDVARAARDRAGETSP